MANASQRADAEGLPEMQGAKVARADTAAHIGHGEGLPDMRLFVESQEADAPLRLPPLQFAILGRARKHEAKAANGVSSRNGEKRGISHFCKL